MSSDLAALVAGMKPYKEFTKLLKVDHIDTGALVPLVLNNVQRRLINQIVIAEREGRPARLVILKPRQTGMSTALQSVLFHRAMTRRGFKARTVAQQDKNVAFLFGMTEGFYRNLPHAITDLEPFQRRQHRSGNKLLLNNDSSLEVETANNKTAGRGAHAQALHLSEVAFWNDDASTTALSLMQMVQEQIGTLIAMESTPNGMGGFYFDQYMAAKENRSDFVAVFEPWFVFDPYRREAHEWHFNGQGEFKYEGDEEEEANHPEVIRQQGRPLDPEQILWRRHKIANGTDGVEGFLQEFPRDDMSCFLTSGRLYFTSVLVNKWTPKLPIMNADIDGKKVVEAKDGRGPLHVYALPEVGRKYIASLDPAGIQGDHQDKGRAAGDKEDFSCIWVIRRHDMQTVAVYQDRVDPDVLARHASAIGKWYNKALLAPEINGEGMVVLFKLKDELRYPKIYRRQRNESRYEPDTELQGWRTQMDNRPAILAGLRLMLRDAPEKLASELLKKEMGTFVIHNGKPQAKVGAHDDTIMAAAIAYQVAAENPHALILDEQGKPIVKAPQGYAGRVWEEEKTKNGLSAEFNRKYPR